MESSTTNLFHFVLDGHNMKDVIYKWKRNTIEVEKKNIAQFDMKEVQLRSDFMSYVSGEFHRAGKALR